MPGGPSRAPNPMKPVSPTDQAPLTGPGEGGEIATELAERSPDLTDTTDLGGRADKSSAWTVGGLGVANVIRLVSNAGLVWLLSANNSDARDEFGLMTMVSVFMMGLGMFSDVGIGPSIIQSARGDSQRFLNTAWTIQVVRGFLLFGGAWLLAPHFADFFTDAERPGYAYLATLIPVASLQAVFQGFNSTKIFSAERHVNMALKIQGDLVAQVFAVSTMLIWAWVSPGIWALVSGGLVQALVIMVWSHTMLPGERNRFDFERPAAEELFSFGRWIFLSTMITFFALQIDKLVLGGKVDEGTLGVYGQAIAIVNLPQFIGGVLTGTVIFPLLATYARAEPEVLKAKFLSQRKTLLQATLLLFLGVILFSPPFFGLIYEPKFRDAGWIAPLLMISSWFFLLSVTSDRALLARGKPRAIAVSNLVSALGKVAGGMLGFHLGGLRGFIIGLSLGTLAGHVVVQVTLARIDLAIHAQDFKYTAVAALSGAAAWGLSSWLGVQSMEPGPLIIQAVIGVLVCAPLALLLYRRIRAVGVTG